MQGQTPLLYFPNALAVDGKWVLEHTVASFAKIHKPLLKRGVLNGNYHITVAISEVLYENGSSWIRINDKRNHLKAASHVSGKPQGCPKQTCAIDSGGAFYTCQTSSNNESCINNSNGTRCTRSICGTGDGGLPPTSPPRPN